LGHLICSSCCEKLPPPKRCHHCSRVSIFNRCYRVEKIVGSIQIPCSNSKYGCTVKTSYYQKEDHERKCVHAPCFCPEHVAKPFHNQAPLALHQIQVWIGLFCKDPGRGPCPCSSERPGSVISVFCIRPYDAALKFRCDINFTTFRKNSYHTQSSEFPVPSTDLSDGIPSNYFLCVVPKSYLDKDTKILLTVKKKTSPVKI
jgi:E3 ubiquitin-protein ligase SIAH1